ncbi:MAG: hypothetical protein AB8D78_01615 [Akkermansiaceae bacterium]
MKNRMSSTYEKRTEEKSKGSPGVPLGGMGALSLLVKAVILPIGVIFVLAFATETGRGIYSDFRSYFMSPDAVRPLTGESAVDSHFNELSLNEQLNQLDHEGRQLFGELHTWQLDGFTPDRDLNAVFQDNPVSPQVTKRWKARVTTANLAKAEEVAESYNHLRRYYSLVAWRVKQLEDVTDKTVRELPDEARLDSAFKAERNLQQTTFATRDMTRARQIFETQVKPYFE